MFRKPSEDERRDFRPINPLGKDRTPLQMFKEKAEKIAHDSLHNKKKPYCFRCARFDFIDQSQKAIEEMERSCKFITDLSQLNAVTDLNDYGKDDRFEFLKETDALEPVNIGGVKQMTKIGVNRDYICKVRNCRTSIFVSNEEIKSFPLKEVKNV